MTLHYRLNAKFKNPNTIEDLVVQDGDIFEECNFAQPHSNIALFNGVKNLVLIRCNTANCILHPTTKFKQCQSGMYDYCSHTHPHLDLPQEVDNCRHVVDVDNSDLENIVYTRQTISLGKRTDIQLTDLECVDILLPYNTIRKNRNGWQRWVTNG